MARWFDEKQLLILEDGAAYTAPDGTQYPPNFPKSEIPWLQPYVAIPFHAEGELMAKKGMKKIEINRWRAAANQTSFQYAGKDISCDDLSRSDIDAVAGSIALTGEFPAAFPGFWKAADNTFLPLATVDDFKAMYAAMVMKGTQNFIRSQELKDLAEQATSLEDLEAIQW